MSRNTAAEPALPDVDTSQILRDARAFFQEAIVWFDRHWLQILIAVAIGTVLALVLFWLRSQGDRLTRRSTSGHGWPAVFGNAIRGTQSSFIILLAARIVTGVAQPPAAISGIVSVLFTLSAVFQAAIWAREIILGSIEHRVRSENYAGEALMSAMGLIRILVTFAVFAIALVVVLDNLGVNVTGLVAGLGVGGIAIGLAAQGIFADLFAALAIIFDRPFRRGDAISYDQSSGTVEAIGLKSTRIRGLDGEERIISNKNLLDKEIQNNTRRERRRVKFTLGLAYETPPAELTAFPDNARAIIEAQGMTFVRCGFLSFGASSLDFDIEFDSPSADFQAAYDARHRVGIALVKMCAERGLVIPYPTQTTYTAAPDGRLIMPYAQVQPVAVADGAGNLAPGGDRG